MTGPVFPT